MEEEEEKKEQKIFGIISLTCGIIGFFFFPASFAAIVAGCLSLKTIYGKIGLILGCISLALTIVGFLILGGLFTSLLRLLPLR